MPKSVLSHKKHISSFAGISIFYDKGSFDTWCVYIRKGNRSYAPKDTEYFKRLQQLAKKHTAPKLYDDFVRIYEQTNTEITTRTLDLIENLSKNYSDDATEIRLWFTVMYAGMVAEENKAHKILGKRIKRLGVYQVLMLKRSAEHAANYGRGRNWKYLNELMQEYGF